MAARTIHGSAHDTGLPDRSVHCVLTSPPYYSLRAYAGGDEQLIDWPEIAYAPMAGMEKIGVPPMRCALGAEPDAAHYIGHLVHCAREWRRVLRPDGTCWVNLADSFTGSGGAGGDYNEGGLRAGQPKFKGGKSAGLKRKNLMMIPARFALAAQADGWNLRFDVIWSKPNASPESATDRPTRAHEYIYLLTKSEHYFYDAEAIAEPAKSYASLPRDENATCAARPAPTPSVGRGRTARPAAGGRTGAGETRAKSGAAPPATSAACGRSPPAPILVRILPPGLSNWRRSSSGPARRLRLLRRLRLPLRAGRREGRVFLGAAQAGRRPLSLRVAGQRRAAGPFVERSG